MDQISASGGTNQAFDISSGGAQTFLQALQNIAGQLLACEYAMPQSTSGKKIDPSKVLVQYTAGSGSTTSLKLVSDASACGSDGGFYYDNPANPTKLIMCPATCDSVQNDDKGKVDILLGCAVGGPT
jgi:hypothetical protein